ncbi:hypothetical protein PV05_09253 [Exophiala xenobiotica]|uniref:FAS1 domain-containing protein n=1 Tax=Exophiala xenobiotica TaxID=348802 RepID=A0A0D2CUF8_9EURO|nr:uncharacterized protein PV05_09253 [Exophiala xenobiotica]KIW53707.1 hypothetical protein PV05_09253 [Exophiala xenobiotica]
MLQQDIFDPEAYHFVKGEVKYSTDLTNGLKMRTVLGKDVTVTRLNGSIYINAAKVIDPDYMITTGVLHLIDNAMDPNDTDARPEVANTTGLSYELVTSHFRPKCRGQGWNSYRRRSWDHSPSRVGSILLEAAKESNQEEVNPPARLD